MRRLFPFLLILPVRCASPPSCNAEPLALPLGDVQVLPEVRESYIRGISTQVGTPPQNLVLLPSAELNNTYISDEESLCYNGETWGETDCKIRKGGRFYKDASSSFSNASAIADAGGALNESTSESFGYKPLQELCESSLAGTDKIKLEGSVELEHFPFGIPRSRWNSAYTALNPLGLGRNSTYLNALRTAGKISSRVWSIFWGRMWVTNSMDGHLVLGGYDQAKVFGENYTAPLVYSEGHDGSPGCPTGMKITISDIVVNFRGGSSESIFAPNTALPCCIDPAHRLLFEGPPIYIDTFENVAGIKFINASYGLHRYANQIEASNGFVADLTFQLESGLEIRVRNNQYAIPHVDIDKDGSRTFDQSKRDVLIRSVGDLGDKIGLLGRYFLTAAYLMVNHDAGTFTLWQANATNETSLVRVFDEDMGKKCANVTGVIQPSATISDIPSSTTATEREEEDDDAEESGEKPSDGAVIGGSVAGAVVGVTLIVLGFLYFKNRRTGSTSEDTGLESIADEQAGDTYYYYPNEEMEREQEVVMNTIRKENTDPKATVDLHELQ
ncbi:hypothetical protein F66182_5025 [Fusarium sp. NRRL 66182]|nr:hypothetical protein F66182_5025 [Fusarium sp. NRRL 66182]